MVIDTKSSSETVSRELWRYATRGGSIIGLFLFPPDNDGRQNAGIPVVGGSWMD